MELFKLLTSTIAAMLGGALYGTTTIPERWLEKLELHVISEIVLQVLIFG